LTGIGDVAAAFVLDQNASHVLQQVNESQPLQVQEKNLGTATLFE
jgi:hypothetical protein